MSGLQASISTHIARNYLHPGEKEWRTNHPLFWRAVGDHPDRLNNMYFSFLFLLRAVVRAQDTIRKYPYHTGHDADDAAVRELLEKLLATSHTTRRTGATNFTARNSGSSGSSSSSFYDVAYARSPAADEQPTDAESNLKQLLRGDLPEEAMEAVEECRYGFNESDLFQVCRSWLSFIIGDAYSLLRVAFVPVNVFVF